MPELANIRHERFAMARFEQLAKGKGEYSQGKAYQAAGYKCSNGNSARACASRLLTFANGVAQRIQELQAEQRRRARVTVDSITAELEEARELARTNNQTATMVQASGIKAKIHGISIDRIEQGKPGDFSQADSSDQIVEALLKQAYPSLQVVTDDMRDMGREELARHASALYAIASGELQPSAATN